MQNRNLESSKNSSYCTRPVTPCSGDFSPIRTVQLKLHKLWTCCQSFSPIQRWTKQKRRSENSRSQEIRRKRCCSVRLISHCSNNFSKIRTVRLFYLTLWTCCQSFSPIQRLTRQQLRSEVADETSSFSLFHSHFLFHFSAFSLYPLDCKKWLSTKKWEAKGDLT